MNTGHPPHNPWMFHRDEIDILEDAFDEVFRRHEAVRDPVRHALEERVLKEQIETEERTESELTAKFGSSEVSEGNMRVPQEEQSAHAEEDLAVVGSLRELLRRETVRDPLYEQAFLWSTEVARFAWEQYERGGYRSSPLFRAHVNAQLIPARMAFGQTEETHEHADAKEIAQKEYELAELYLARARESLEDARTEGVVPPEMDVLIESAKPVAEGLRQLRERLNRPFGFRS